MRTRVGKGLIFLGAAAAALLFAAPAGAQNIENIMEQMAEAGASAEDAEECLQQYSVLDLNLATRSELLASGLFTPFQIESLLEYRAEYGALLSAAELALVDGFSKELCDRLAGRITLGSGTAATTSLQARSRFKYKSGTGGVHQYNRILLQHGPWQGGLLAESDAGEKPLIDHVGGYLAYEKGPWKVIAGDYSACFGQGAALWSAFAFSGAGAPASLLRRTKGITPYKSADENRALRGAAVTRALGGGWEATLLLSAAAVDAKVTDEGYTSISKTGYHRTIYEKSCKNAMREYLAGANITRRGEHLHCGITAVAYGYNRRNARKAEPYNRLQMYDGLCGNISADALLSLGHWRLFAEAALGRGLRPAAVAGAVFSPSYSFEAALHLRCYHEGYIAPHAGSRSSISSVSNQTGAVLSLLWRPIGSLTLNSQTEAVHYPGVRYRVDGPSSAFVERLSAELEAGDFTFSLRENYSRRSADLSRRHSLKGTARWEKGLWSCTLRAGVSLCNIDGSACSGTALSAGAARGFLRGRLSAAVSASWYNAGTYDARVYLYESDLPGNFTFNYYLGKGIAARLLVKAKMGRGVTLSGLAAYTGGFEARVQADFDF